MTNLMYVHVVKPVMLVTQQETQLPGFWNISDRRVLILRNISRHRQIVNVNATILAFLF